MLDMFFKKENEEKVVVPQQPSFNLPPQQSAPPPVVNTTTISQKVVDTYNSEFKKIDTPGIDYYDFHNGVIKAGISKISVDMMYNLLQGMSPTMSKDMMVMQAKGAVDKMDIFMEQAYKMAALKKDTLLNSYRDSKSGLEKRKMSIQAQIEALNAELISVQSSIDSMSDKSDEIRTIDNTYNEFTQVHAEFKYNVNSIISHLNAGL